MRCEEKYTGISRFNEAATNRSRKQLPGFCGCKFHGLDVGMASMRAATNRSRKHASVVHPCDFDFLARFNEAATNRSRKLGIPQVHQPSVPRWNSFNEAATNRSRKLTIRVMTEASRPKPRFNEAATNRSRKPAMSTVSFRPPSARAAGFNEAATNRSRKPIARCTKTVILRQIYNPLQ